MVPLGGDLVGAGLGEDGPEGGGHHLVVALGDAGQQVPGEVDPAALVGRPLEAAPDGGDQAGVLVRDDQLHAGEAPGAQGAQEATPEGLVFGVADVEAQDLPAPVGSDPGGDDHGLGGHVVVVADVQVGGVQEDVGESGWSSRRVRKAPTASSRPAQMRLTSDF